MPSRRKAQIRRFLTARDWPGLIAEMRPTQATLSVLVSLSYDADELIRWRAVEGVGEVAGVLARTDIERVRNLIRRLLWSMNDESGGVGWHAPETIGEVLANVPSLVGEIGILLTAFLRQAPFERGAHLAVYRAASVEAAPFADSTPELVRSLRSNDPYVRGLAALALGAIGKPVHRPDVEALRTDASPVTLYDFEAGRMTSTTASRLAERAAALLDRSQGT